MKLYDFFRNIFANTIFIRQEARKNAFSDITVDYNLSRSLYTTASVNETTSRYQLGNFCTPTFINTFAWYIGVPSISSDQDEYANDVNKWMKRNRSKLLSIVKQVLVDAKHYVWIRAETDKDNKVKIVLRQIPRDWVDKDETVRNEYGGFDTFVFNVKENVKGEVIETKWTLKPGIEIYKKNDGEAVENGTKINDVLVFEIMNNKQPYMTDGIPEIAPVVPYIQKYDAILRDLGKHVQDGLVPRLIFKVRNMVDFIMRSFGVSKETLEKDGFKFDSEQFDNAFFDDKDDKVEYLQLQDRSESAIKALELLYYIFIELTMPEYCYGASLNSTNASVSEQSPVWAKKVEGKQGELDEFFYWVADKYLLLSNLNLGRARYKPENIEVSWPEVTVKDDMAMMNAFSSLMTAIEKAMELRLIGPEVAFNSIKMFIPLSGEYKDEKEKAEAFTRVKLKVENIKARLLEGDVDVGDLISNLFKGE